MKKHQVILSIIEKEGKNILEIEAKGVSRLTAYRLCKQAKDILKSELNNEIEDRKKLIEKIDKP